MTLPSGTTELQLYKSRLEAQFLQRMMAKTGWGRNEVMQQFREAMRDAEIEMLREHMTK